MTCCTTIEDAPTSEAGHCPLDRRLGLVIEALGAYWDTAYAEGLEGRTHDTNDGAAERARRNVMASVAALVAAERELWKGRASPSSASMAAANSMCSSCAKHAESMCTPSASTASPGSAPVSLPYLRVCAKRARAC